jgi:Ser/Thr protein kinase RdoA (MazF antagonist)
MERTPMKAFEDLSDAGRLRRLRTMARAALLRYDIDRPEVTFHAFETNLLYRVTSASGDRFVLRLAVPGWRTLTDHRSEAAWLEALARDTGVGAPRIVPSRAGEPVVQLEAPDVPGTWNAMLMTWVPGRLLGRFLSERNLEKLGALFAELHHHGATWRPPEGFTSRRFEHWLSRGEENLVTGGGRAGPPAGVLSAEARELLDRVDQAVVGAYAAIDRSDLRVIHCDLWHDNVKLHRGALHPFDFEDTVWGFRAHDIAMAMLDLLESTDESRYSALLPAFRRGYEAHLAWPADPIEPLQVGRLLWKVNWVAHHRPDRLAMMVGRHVPVFERFLATGGVMLPLEEGAVKE